MLACMGTRSGRAAIGVLRPTRASVAGNTCSGRAAAPRDLWAGWGRRAIRAEGARAVVSWKTWAPSYSDLHSQRGASARWKWRCARSGWRCQCDSQATCGLCAPWRRRSGCDLRSGRGAMSCRACRVLSCHVASCHVASRPILSRCVVSGCESRLQHIGTATSLSHCANAPRSHSHCSLSYHSHSHSLRPHHSHACAHVVLYNSHPISSAHPRLLLELQMWGYPVLSFIGLSRKRSCATIGWQLTLN